ncbi:MAG: hypothetical protein JNL21_29825 [Myxococcales bacterium]|nr:hypothetical protein [Myxococcales bacterium]
MRRTGLAAQAPSAGLGSSELGPSWLGLACLLAFGVGCGGASPLMHPAHVLSEGKVSVGAGAAGQITALERAQPVRDDKSGPVLEEYAVSPGLSPWASGRVGITGDNEAGITYAGRAFRVDFRHAFQLDPVYLSLGLGGSGVVPRPKGGGDDLGSAYGGGGDVPILIGWKSTAELYSVWAGARGGFEILSGNALESEVIQGGREDVFMPFSGNHYFVGGLVGTKLGFRNLHVALEVDVLYHFGNGTFGQNQEKEASVEQLTISPGSALILTF